MTGGQEPKALGAIGRPGGGAAASEPPSQWPSALAPLVVSMGEPAGIGGEITLAAWRAHRADLPPFCLIDDPDRLGALASRLDWTVPIARIGRPSEALACFADALPVLAEPLPVEAVPGCLDPRNAPAVLAAIQRGVQAVQAGEASALVTNPIHKKALYDAGFRHPGHTEYLAELTRTYYGPEAPAEPVMMLASEGEGSAPPLRVVPVTIHIALAEIPQRLTEAALLSCARILAASLKRDYGLAHPRLAVAGLNPHAGEEGSMGREEITLIAPAVARLQAEGLTVVGPLPADTLFHAEARRHYDAVLCMYHDQALIPLKTVDFAGGVNATLGLPFIRTSPDHGTALGLAGQGRADATSLCAALSLAGRMARHRFRVAQGHGDGCTMEGGC